jgi:hypothetical protein
VTDNATETSDDDTAEDWDYFDPDEDQDTEEVTEDEAPDDEEEGEPEGEAEEAEPEETPVVYAEDTAVVKLADGTEVPIAEIKNGYLRQSDYSRKTQEVANERKTVQADVERMQRITTAFVEHISALVPDAPDTALAYSDAAKYTAQKAQHEAAMAQVQKLIELGHAPKEVGDTMSAADRQKMLHEENEKLISLIPEAGAPEGRQAFFKSLQPVAKDFGFSDEELGGLTDHRIFALAHWAAKGKAAEKATATAKAKVAKAPPATPRKPGQGARKANGNADAMRKLSQSGSLRDALAVDWD